MGCAHDAQQEHEGTYDLPVSAEDVRNLLRSNGYKPYDCECGNKFWYQPNKLTACRNCNQVILETPDGQVHKAFRS